MSQRSIVNLDLNSLSQEKLLELAGNIIQCLDKEGLKNVQEKLRAKGNRLEEDTKRLYRVGDKVKFKPNRDFGFYYGTITKINQKTIKVRTVLDNVWLILPSELRLDNSSFTFEDKCEKERLEIEAEELKRNPKKRKQQEEENAKLHIRAHNLLGWERPPKSFKFEIS